MRNQIGLAINGEATTVDPDDVGLTLSEFLRQRQRMTGTKVVCAEGDCGACSVLCANTDEGLPFRYHSIDSCIQFMYQLDGMHIITVEGLAGNDALHPVQEAMVQHFGSQCGFCTPGFVTAMTGVAHKFADSRTELDTQLLKRELSGNLCRCTGYQQIIEAGCSLKLPVVPKLSDLYDEASIAQLLQSSHSSAAISMGEYTSYLPNNLSEAVKIKQLNPEALLIAGATDLGVQHNKKRLSAGDRILLTKCPELKTVQRTDKEIVIGAGVSWEKVRSVIAADYPCFDELLDLFGSPQIRNAGTLGGNLMNASPIADSVPFLMVTDSIMEVQGPDGTRKIPIEQFYTGYKQTALSKDEILVRVRVPIEYAEDEIQLLKISQRRDMDISTVTCGLRIKLANNTITEARVAFGGVGPVAHRLPKTESLLSSEDITLDLFERAGSQALQEVKPISDVRGSSDYRLQLVKNALTRFAHEIIANREGTILPRTTTAVGHTELQA